MRALIDTHSYIWYIKGDNRLSDKAQQIIDNISNDIFISIASLWELSIKIKLGKLKIISDFNGIKNDLIKYNISVLPLEIDDILQNLKLDYYHKDPFDRIIISQAICRKMPIIGKDENFISYPVDTIW